MPTRASKRRALLGLALAALAVPATADTPHCIPAELTTRFGDWSDENIVVRKSFPDQLVRPIPGGKAAAAMRLLLAVNDAGATDWTLAIHNAAGHLVGLLDRQDFADAHGRIWTGRLSGPQVIVSLRGGDDRVEVEVRGSVAMGPPGANDAAFSISGTEPNWRSPFPTAGPIVRDAVASVGMLVGVRSRANAAGAVVAHDSWCCSGVMVGKNLFLTNWHCGNGTGTEAWNAEVVGNALVDLAWEEGPVRRQFNVTKVELANRERDIAILRLRPIAGAEGGIRRATPVALSPAPAALGQQVFMVHHAQCQPKRISQGCRIRETGRPGWLAAPGATDVKSELAHDCDSEPGASGAPIFDLQGRLLALHHLGFQKDAGPMCPADRVNKAITLSAIAAYVREEDRDLADALRW